MELQSCGTIWVAHAKVHLVHFKRPQARNGICAVRFRRPESCHPCAQDPAIRSALRAGGNAWVGPHLHASTDNGKTGNLRKRAEVQGITGKSWQVTKKEWSSRTTDAREAHMAHRLPARLMNPSTVYLGSDPGVLFRSGGQRADLGKWFLVCAIIQLRGKMESGSWWHDVASIQCLAKADLCRACPPRCVSHSGCENLVAFSMESPSRIWAGTTFPRKSDRLRPQAESASPQNRIALSAKTICGVYAAESAGEKGPDHLDKAFFHGSASVWKFLTATKDNSLRSYHSPRSRYVPKGSFCGSAASQRGQNLNVSHQGPCLSPIAYESFCAKRCPPTIATLLGIFSVLRVGHSPYSGCGDSWHVLSAHLPPIYL